jgi:hypothetical protein
MPPPSRPGKGGGSRGGRLPPAQGEQGARPGGAAGPAPGRGPEPCQQPRCHRTSQLMAVLRLGGRRGRPRRRPEELCADGAYDTREIRHHLRRRGIGASIPENSRGQRRPRRDRPVDLLGHLPGGEGGGRALLRLAQGRVPQAGPAVRAALDHLRCPGLPGLLPRRLGAFEMSPY